MTRSKSLTVAAILQALLSAFSVVVSLGLVASGSAAIGAAGQTPPYAILLFGLITGAIGLVAAYGLWINQKWAKVLTIILRVLDILSALPGVLFAPTDVWRAMAITGISLGIIVIALILRREPRPALAA